MRRLSLRNNDLLKSPFLDLAVVSCLGWYLAKNFAIAHSQVGYIIFAIFVGAAIFKYPKLGIGLMFLSIFFFKKYIIFYGVIPRQFGWLPEFVLAVLSLKVILIGIKRKRFLKTPINIPILLLALVSIISSVISGNPLITTLLGLRLYFRFILMFFLIIHLGFDEKFFRTMAGLLLVLIFIQIPLSIILKTIMYVPRDMAGGTLGSNEGGFLALFALFVMLGLMLYRKRHIFLYALGLGALLLLPYLSESIGTFIFLPITLFLLFRSMLIKNIFISIFSFLMLVFFYILILQVLPESNSVTRKLGMWISSPLDTYQGQMASRYGPLYSRMGPIENSLQSIYKSPGNAIFGKGPGSATDSYFSSYTGKFFGSEGAGRAQLSVSILEIGSFGTFLFLVIIYKVFRLNKAFREKTDDNYWKSISFGFEGLIFLFVLGTVYMTIWISDLISFTFWLVASVIYSVSYRISCDNRQFKMLSKI